MSVVATFIEYGEKPVAKNEEQVARLFEQMVQWIEYGDIDSFASAFSEDAVVTIIGKNENKVDKKTFLNRIARDLFNVRKILYNNVVVRVYRDDEAVIFCSVSTILRDKALPSNGTDSTFKFRKINGGWRVVEILHVK